MQFVPTLSREEVLRYLGWKGTEIPPGMEEKIRRCMEDARALISPAYVYRRFSLVREEGRLRLSGTSDCLEGKSIQAHLSGCGEVFLLAATLGLAIDREIRRRTVTVPEEALILDACATAAIEETADEAQNEMAALCKQEGRGLTWRFSPGYGDLPLSTQKWLLPLLDAPRKLGLTLTGSLLMVPGKSVTALLGVTPLPKETEEQTGSPCGRCPNRETCAYRTQGEFCR